MEEALGNFLFLKFSLQAILLGISLKQTDGVLEYFVGAFESNNGLYFTS